MSDEIKVETEPVVKRTLSKEQCLFKVDNEGKAIPEKVDVEIYDRDLDRELIHEGIQLMELVKRNKSAKKLLEKELLDLSKKVSDAKSAYESCQDQTHKIVLAKDYDRIKLLYDTEKAKSELNEAYIDERIAESRSLIRQLKEKREATKEIMTIEAVPCTIGESILVFEKFKTIEGLDTIDWVSDLITKKVISPKFTFEEAKLLKPDYKIGLKEAIMRISEYQVKDYRDVMTELQLLEEKPLTIKKD